MDNKERKVFPIANHPETSLLIDERVVPNHDLEELLTLAGVDASFRGHNYLGPEHILLAFDQTQNSRVRRFLESEGLSFYDLDLEFHWTVGRADTTTSAMEINERVKKAVKRAAEISIEDGKNSLGPEQLFLALMEDPDALATQVVRRRTKGDLDKKMVKFRSSLKNERV